MIVMMCRLAHKCIGSIGSKILDEIVTRLDKGKMPNWLSVPAVDVLLFLGRCIDKVEVFVVWVKKLFTKKNKPSTANVSK